MSTERASSVEILKRYPRLKEIPEGGYPGHVLIIPDGNGRWASKFNQIPFFGHKKGADILKETLRNFRELPIKTVTVWGFSTENWKRPEKEIIGLMDIFDDTINQSLPELERDKIRFVHLGRKDRLPPKLLKSINNAESETQFNTGQHLCLAIDFGGQDQEIRIIQKAIKLGFKEDQITSDLIKTLRDGDGLIPPADLIIRTSGELRTSGLGWIADYAEFHSINSLLPDTKPEDYMLALVDFSKRQRRFGARSK